MTNVFRADQAKVIIGDNKFDSRRKFLRVVGSGQDAFFSKGKTFAYTELGRRPWFISWRWRNGPYNIAEKGAVTAPEPPAIADTSERLKF